VNFLKNKMEIRLNHRRTNIWAKIKEEKEMKKTRPP